jgi:hypothetical protein
LVASIARGRRWLDELIAEETATTESIAKRERCSVRKVNMTISLAFLAPDLVKAAIDGQLPPWHGSCPIIDGANERNDGLCEPHQPLAQSSAHYRI